MGTSLPSTSLRLDFWRERKASPSWTAKVNEGSRFKKAATRTLTSVDRCISAHAGDRTAYVGLEAGNTLAVLRLKMKRMSLMEAMVDLHCVAGKQRKALLKRWIARVMAERARKEL